MTKVPNYCYNCGNRLKKKKGNCPNCGIPFIQGRRFQIPREYLAPKKGWSKAFHEYKTLITKRINEDTTPSEGKNKFLILLETTDLLDKAFILLANRVEHLARKELELKYGLMTDSHPNFCSRCGYTIEGSWILCPICGKELFFILHNYKEAMEYIQKAINIDPENHKLKNSLERAKKIVAIEKNTELALLNLLFVKQHNFRQISFVTDILTRRPR